MSKISRAFVVALPTAAKKQATAAAANADLDAHSLTAKQLKAMVPLRAVQDAESEGIG